MVEIPVHMKPHIHGMIENPKKNSNNNKRNTIKKNNNNNKGSV